MIAHEHFKVSDVAEIRGRAHTGYGFAITDLHDTPLLRITYGAEDEAIEARKAIDAALTKAIAVYV